MNKTGFGGAMLRVSTVVMAAIAVATAVVLGRGLVSPNFWFDEANQFWLAMGQFAHTPAHTPTRSWYDVWNYSKSFNADPGGFTALLRLWADLFGASPMALRSLPAVFGYLFLFLTYCWARWLAVPRPAAIAIALVFLLSQNIPYFTVELRAYSMELCGVVALWLATMALLERPDRRRLIIWIAVNWLFLSSRYSFVIYSGAACAILLWRAREDRSARDIFLLAIAATAFWALVLYFGMLRFQSAGGVPPDYVAELMIAGHWRNFPHIVLRNLFHPAAIWATAFIALLLVVIGLRRRNGLPPDARLQPFIWLAAYILIATLGWLTLSVLGKMPWDVSKRWSLSIYGLSALALPALVSLAWLCVKDRLRLPPARARAGIVLLCGISLLIGANSLRVMATRYDRDQIVSEHLAQALGVLDCGAGNTVLLDASLWPHYRYLTERSGLNLRCAAQVKVTPVVIQDAAAYAAQGLGQGRPVTYIFGSWDPQLKAGVLQRLQGQGKVEAESFGPSDFTTIVTLK